MVEKKNNKVLKIVGIVVGVIIALVVVGSFMGGSDDMQGSSLNQEKIDKVRKISPDGAAGITYEEAYNYFFSDSDWKYFKSDDGDPVVEFSGKCTYDDQEGDAYLQFTLDDDDNIASYYAQFKYDGEDEKVELGDDERWALIFKPFETYAEDVKEEPLTDEEISELYM